MSRWYFAPFLNLDQRAELVLPGFKLRRLKLIQATDCLYELDGENDLSKVQVLHSRHLAATSAYQAKVARWNARQNDRKSRGKEAQTAADFFAFLGI